MSLTFDTRIGAYGVIVRGDEILLAHWSGHGRFNWTLPGGGLEAGEDAITAAKREILEETGYRVSLEQLLGVDSVHIPAGARLDRASRQLHSFRVIYGAHILGGDLRIEVGGSTDDARWFRLRDVPQLHRVDLVDIGIKLWRESGAGRKVLANGSVGLPQRVAVEEE
ncbi:MAG: NUDIX hydrolase [Trueperaceae bacterium]